MSNLAQDERHDLEPLFLVQKHFWSASKPFEVVFDPCTASECLVAQRTMAY